MKIEVCATIGCYISKSSFKATLIYPSCWTEETAMESFNLQELYPRALEETESWDGTHAFDGEEDEDEDEDEDDRLARLEDHAEYYCVLWDEKEHAGRCTYNTGLDDRGAQFLERTA